MKRQINFLLLLGVFTIMFSCKNEQATNPSQLDKAETMPLIRDQYIVLFNNGFLTPSCFVTPADLDRETAGRMNEEYREQGIRIINQWLADNGISEDAVIDYYTDAVAGVALRIPESVANSLVRSREVSLVEQDREISLPPNEFVESEDNGLRAQTTPCGITQAGGSADGSASTKWIWIVDTGIDLTHPDLNVETSSTYAKSFVGGSANDCNGHGTHCAGIAAAKNNTVGVIGVSAGARVVPVRVLGCNGSGQTSGILSGLNHVAAYDEAGDVVNMSLGGYWGANCATNSSYVAAITNLSNAGTRVCIAGGNSSANAALYTPACINASNVFTVASMTCGYGWSSFSNWGIPPTDWIATGSSVYSTYKGGGYATLSGTSMASPHVAGIVHARQAAPAQNGTVTNGGVSYKIAVR